MLPQSKEAPNTSCKNAANLLMFYTVFFAAISITKCFIINPSILFGDLIGILILVCCIMNYDHFYTSLFVFFTIVPVAVHIAMLGEGVQRGKFYSNRRETVVQTMLIIGLVTYFVGWYLCLRAYREFKAASRGLPDIYLNSRRQAERQYERLARERDDEEIRPIYTEQGFQAFRGNGVQIG